MSAVVAEADGIDVSVVVIGRNEAAHLGACFDSVAAADWAGLRHELIYVDSQSTDGSVSIARRAGACVLQVGTGRPTAAAGRNLGWRRAAGRRVLFLDGDTRLHPGFVQRAAPLLDGREVVAVWGHRREADPGQSIYTRVIDLDWVFATGPADYFGGDALVCRSALEAVGGFDDHLPAGEEPELGRRLRQRGGRIVHIDVPMTQHDLAIRSAGGWWRRAERAGWAYAEVAHRSAGTADPLWRRESRRNRVHGLAVLALPGALAAAAWALPVAGWAGLAGTLLLVARSAWRCRWKCPGQPGLALAYAVHSHLQQVPILCGQASWVWQRLRRSAPVPIDYRQPAAGDRP